MNSGSAIRNFSASGGNFVITALLNFWFTPFLVRNLGVEGYGLVPLAMQVTAYMTLATLALNAATSRFVMQAITIGDHDKAARLFNTAFSATIGLVAVLILPAAYVAYNIDKVITLPASMLEDARLLFAATFAAFLIGALRSPFEVSMFCKNRLDIQNGISVLDTLIKVGTTVAIFWLASPSLGNVGLGILAASLSTSVLSVASWKILTPALKLDSRMWDKAMLRSLTSVGGWSVVNQIGSLLFLSVDLVIANRYLGVEAAGIYAALLMWPMMVRTMAGYIAMNFNPTFVHLNSRGEIGNLAHFSISSVRVMGFLTIGPLTILSGLSAPLLTTWLGSEWAAHHLLLDFLLLNLVLNVPLMPLFGLAQTKTNMQVAGIFTLVAGVFNVVTSLLLCLTTSLGLWGIAISGFVWLNLKNGLFLPIYITRTLDHSAFNIEKIYLALISPMFIGIVVWLPLRYYVNSREYSIGWSSIFLLALVAEIVFIGLCYLLPGTKYELIYLARLLNSLSEKSKSNNIK